jgi:hypothetical protein
MVNGEVTNAPLLVANMKKMNSQTTTHHLTTTNQAATLLNEQPYIGLRYITNHF